MNKLKQNRTDKRNPLIKALEIDFLSREQLMQSLPFTFFLSLLGIIYIGNRLNAEKQIKRLDKLQTEIKDAEADYLTINSEFMYQCNQSQIAKKVTRLGLKELGQPPKLIVRKPDEH